MTATKIPDFLKKGDTIAIAASARKVQIADIQWAIDYLENQGFCVVLANNIGADFHQWAGNDKERIQAWNQLFKDKSIKAILCARGGYGTSRIIDHLDWHAFVQQPKWIAGFSDVTVLLAAISQHGTSAIHSPMAFNFEQALPETLTHFVHLLTGQWNTVSNPPQLYDRKGIAQGKLIGGNLSLLAHIIGSPSDFDYEDVILFIEDIDEYYYNIDRMWYQLFRSGKLKKVKGLIIGHFTDLKDHAIPLGIPLQEILTLGIAPHIPIAWQFPVGHITNHFPLVVGASVELSVSIDGAQLAYIQ